MQKNKLFYDFLLLDKVNLKNKKWEKPILKDLLMKFYNCLIKSFQSRHKIIDKSDLLSLLSLKNCPTSNLRLSTFSFRFGLFCKNSSVRY